MSLPGLHQVCLYQDQHLPTLEATLSMETTPASSLLGTSLLAAGFLHVWPHIYAALRVSTSFNILYPRQAPPLSHFSHNPDQC